MNWLWIGDSHLDAMHSRIRDLSTEKGIGGRVAYRGGWSSIRWLRRGDISSLVADGAPDVLVVVLGTNDDPVDPEAMRALIAQVGAARTVWFGPFHSAARDAEFRAAIGSSFVSGAAMAEGLAFRSGGNVHLTPEGYAALSARLVDRAAAEPRSTAIGLAVVAGCVLAAVGLVAIGSSPRLEKKWTAREVHPFDPRFWGSKPRVRGRKGATA